MSEEHAYLVEQWQPEQQPVYVGQPIYTTDPESVIRAIARALARSAHINVWKIDISNQQLMLSTHEQTRQGFEENGQTAT